MNKKHHKYTLSITLSLKLYVAWFNKIIYKRYLFTLQVTDLLRSPKFLFWYTSYETRMQKESSYSFAIRSLTFWQLLLNLHFAVFCRDKLIVANAIKKVILWKVYLEYRVEVKKI